MTFTSIFRAKGNEAAMVYVVDSQNCATDVASARNRNILFTAITRSKAWVRVVGIGSKMKSLVEEYNKIEAQNFKLAFKYPNKKVREKLNIIHRDKSRFEEEKIEKRVTDMFDLLKDIKNGNMYKEDIPSELLAELKELIKDE
ncbi:ATP-binding domain-containing protein [Fusobacterium polymorphum]